MKRIVIIGCGIVGAMIAYELSQISNFQVTVLDRHPPAQAATGAALGVLMGIISQKTKGRAWELRQTSIQRYATLLPELETITGELLPWNQQGILKLCFEADDSLQWQRLIERRRQQGWQLELWQPEQIQAHCPQINHPQVKAAIYSPQDYQVDPTAVTLALVKAAQGKGATFQFDVEVKALSKGDSQHCDRLLTSAEDIPVDAVVIAAGLGSTPLAASVGQSVLIHPVLGQALQIQLAQPLGLSTFQPVITGNDIHIVPLTDRTYWIGATVEFPEGDQAISPSADRLTEVWQAALALCPDLAKATILKTWSGLRPRPQNRPAPVIEPLSGYDNVLLATGHYRNGILLAPATAQLVRSALANRFSILL